MRILACVIDKTIVLRCYILKGMESQLQHSTCG